MSTSPPRLTDADVERLHLAMQTEPALIPLTPPAKIRALVAEVRERRAEEQHACLCQWDASGFQTQGCRYHLEREAENARLRVLADAVGRSMYEEVDGERVFRTDPEAWQDVEKAYLALNRTEEVFRG